MGGVLHDVDRAFNILDYVLLGIWSAILLLSALGFPERVYRTMNSTLGQAVTVAMAIYFLVRWLIDQQRVPFKVEHPTDADKSERYRMLRNAFMDYCGLVLTLSSLTVTYLRGQIDTLQARLAGQAPAGQAHPHNN